MNKNILSLIIVFGALLFLLSIAIILINTDNNQDSKTTDKLDLRQSFENEGYKNLGKMGDSPCETQDPECGYCSGMIIEGYCLVKP